MDLIRVLGEIVREGFGDDSTNDAAETHCGLEAGNVGSAKVRWCRFGDVKDNQTVLEKIRRQA